MNVPNTSVSKKGQNLSKNDATVFAIPQKDIRRSGAGKTGALGAGNIPSYGRLEQIRKCKILLIGATEWKRTRRLLEALKGAAILPVEESDDFTAGSGVVGFQLDSPHIRVQIALDTAEHGRLRISSTALGLEEIVKRQP